MTLHKYLDMREIHFYTNICNEEQVSIEELENMSVDYIGTINKIKNKNIRVVRTTQLFLLENIWTYIDMGFKIYLHNGIEVREVKDGMNAAGEVKNGTNILMCLLHGWFGEIS